MLYKLLGASVFISIVLAVGLYLSHQKNLSQARTIDEMSQQLSILDKQIKARDSSASILKQEKEKAAKERDMYKRKLNESEADSVCRDVPLNDNTKRVLDELYRSQASK